jgi:UDP-glucuronate decarboxylase
LLLMHSMKRVLVTGGAGFLGSHLCQMLIARGNRVMCLDTCESGSLDNVAHLTREPRFSLIARDVAEPVDIVADEIYHLACPASPRNYQRDPIRTIRTAVVGTMRVLELARATGARVLITSTSEIYGDPEQHPQREDYWGRVNPIGVRSCYDEGKRCAEALASSYQRQHRVEVRIARVFNTYGPRMMENDGRVISNFVVQALRGQPLTVYGDGSQTRSFCYVDDLVAALVRLMGASFDPGPVNLGNPAELSVREVAALVLELSGSPSRLVYRHLPGDDPSRRRPDITRARTVLGWEPRVSLREGLVRTVSYFRERMTNQGACP